MRQTEGETMYFHENDKLIPYVTADPHYFHNRVSDYCKRPYKNETDMRNNLIANYNACVPPEGLCFFIGDIAMIGTSQWERLGALMKKLNGIKHLILGNHDEIKPFRYLDCGFTSVHTSLTVIVEIDEKRRYFFLNHDPNIWDQVPDEYVLICGHVHNLFKMIPQKNVINVGVDVWGYKPVSLQEAWGTMRRMQNVELTPVIGQEHSHPPTREVLLANMGLSEDVVKPKTETG